MSNLNDEYWEPVLEGFREMNPTLADRVIDWYPVRQMEIMVKLDDGSKYFYNFLNQETMSLKRYLSIIPDDEIDFRELFSDRLSDKMSAAGLTQMGLSEHSKISQVTISNYINCKATPSAYNLMRICNALNCTPNELLYFIK